MKEITIKVYSLNELSEKAKRKAIDSFKNDSASTELEMEFLTEDAENIGLKMSDGSTNASFIHSAIYTANEILSEHGEVCMTARHAAEFLTNLNTLESDFLRNIDRDYKVMLRDSLEYISSDESIIEGIYANNIMFLESGDRPQY